MDFSAHIPFPALFKKKRSVLLFLSIGISLMVFGQSGRNYAKKQQVSNDGEKIFIKYEIQELKDNPELIINLKVKGKKIIPKTVIGKEFTGYGEKEITWLYTADDLTPEEVNKLKVIVVAYKRFDPIPKETVILTGATSGAVGLGLLTSGLFIISKNSKNHDHFKIYSENSDPNDLQTWVGDLGYDSREDLYDTINGRYKTGQVLAYSGIAVLTAGYLLFKSLQKKGKNVDNGNLSISPTLGTQDGTGFGIVYHF